MEKITHISAVSPFNGILETGIRVIFLLHASYPRYLDVQRLTAMDYLIVHTELLDGPVDLHPPTLTISPVTQVRRKSVQDSLNLMMSKELVSKHISEKGIHFIAGEYSTFFIDSLQSNYLHKLYERAHWLSEHFKNYDDFEFDALMKELLENWVAEFQDDSNVSGSIQ